MSPDPYVDKLFKDAGLPFTEKTAVTGRINCTLHARSEKRGLELAPFPSRAVLKHEIHELILTDEDGGPGKTVNRIAYLGFFEVEQGGILWVGDEVSLGGVVAGRLAGYDLTHFPNHFNIIVKAVGEVKTGHESGFYPGTQVVFRFQS